MRRSFFNGLLATCVSLSIASCGSTEKELVKPNDKYGGTFVFSKNEKVADLFPHSAIDIHSSHIILQIYDGLLKFDSENLELIGAIADSWTSNEDKTMFEFTLKKDVFFHKDPCFADKEAQRVTAEDVKYSFELLCRPDADDQLFGMTFKDVLKGANEYHKSLAKEVEGIEVIDELTIRFKLATPSAVFLYRVAHPMASIIPKEGFEKYGSKNKIGSGPFQYVSGENESEILLIKNNDYHLKDAENLPLPYLDTVKVKVISTLAGELKAFRKEELSILFELPAKKISEELSDNIAEYKSNPPSRKIVRPHQMSTQFYEFNMTREHFKDVRVRKAITYAINKKKIVKDIQKDQALMPGYYGIVPPIREFVEKHLDTAAIGALGYRYNPELARKLFEEAGYPNGKGFPTLTLEVNGKHLRVANEVSAQLRKELNINIELRRVDFEQLIEDDKYAVADLTRSGWVADYPSPESFLSLAYGKNVPESLEEPSYPNCSRYKSRIFDEQLDNAMLSNSERFTYKYYTQADQTLLEDCPMFILWYGEYYQLYQSNVRNYYPNAMEYLDLSNVYFKEFTKEDREKEVKGEL